MARSWRMLWPVLGRLLLDLDRGLLRGVFGQIWMDPARNRLTWGDFGGLGPSLADFGLLLTNIDRVGPMLTTFGQAHTHTICPKWVGCGKGGANFD